MEPFRVFSPSKINLTLAITGVRPDGFHDLVSLVAPLDWGDTLEVRLNNEAGHDTLACDFPGVPTDSANLILKAAVALRAALPGGAQPPFVHFVLEKNTPAGAGLGGGSGNAAAALLALNRLSPAPVAASFLEKIAAAVGSDCPLFVRGKPVIMRGRGEQLEALPPQAERAISGRRVCIFKPSFGINTGWAYGQMKAQAPKHYLPPAEAEAMLAAWMAHPTDALPLFNNMQGVAFEKYVALPTLLDQLRARFQVPCIMSGSGSACFALPNPDTDVAALRACVESAWGPHAWIADCRTA